MVLSPGQVGLSPDQEEFPKRLSPSAPNTWHSMAYAYVAKYCVPYAYLSFYVPRHALLPVKPYHTEYDTTPTTH